MGRPVGIEITQVLHVGVTGVLPALPSFKLSIHVEDLTGAVGPDLHAHLAPGTIIQAGPGCGVSPTVPTAVPPAVQQAMFYAMFSAMFHTELLGPCWYNTASQRPHHRSCGHDTAN